MTSPEAEDMNMISASVVGLTHRVDMFPYMDMQFNILGSASLYGYALT